MKKRLNVIDIVAAMTLLLVMASCGVERGEAVGVQRMKNPPKHVILVGFDGLSAYALNHGADMPAFRKMMGQGSYTLVNRSVLPSSSAVNWASMFMGAGPELHGYTDWGSRKPDLPSRELTSNGMFPDLYYLIRKAHPQAELGYIYQWDGMRYLVDTLSVSHLEPVMLSAADTDKAVASTISYIVNKRPDFCSVIFDEPDGTGHGKGWESKEYFAMLSHLDKALAAIVKAVEEAGMMDETVFVLTADHGGFNAGHGGKTMNEMQTPIVFCGKGIKKSFKIPESTMVYDIASTIGYMFGINQPQVWIARPIMSVFEK